MGEIVHFESTVWTVIDKAKKRDPAAIDRMISNYSAPLLAFIRNRGFSPEDAEDILQEVLIRIYDSEFLVKADRLKGKFRSILLGVTKNCVLKLLEKRGAQKRGGGLPSVSLEDLRVNEDGEIPVAAEENADFNRLWFQNVFRLSMRKLEEESFQTAKTHHKALVMKLRGASYQQIARELGTSEADVTNLLHAAKKKLQAIAQEIIANYSSTTVELQLDQELFNRMIPES